uniref:Uncharacterized protein n=1 Tax=viral metagenome TaxID=1070528 RepID=A0A6C0IHG9_9ZZZZ
MEPFDTKLASLTYLTNPLYQQIIKQQKEIKKTSNKSDIKFYRKRITSLTKDMLKGEIPDNAYIKHIYETYVNGLIKYFKTVDTTDIIQKQYVSEANVSGANVSEANVSEANVSEANVSEAINDNDDTDLAHIKAVNINDSLMRKYPSVATLDNFVIKTQSESKDVRIIPVILEVDLKEPSLKKKGVKDKDKNKVKMKEPSFKKKSNKLDTITESVNETVNDNEIIV